MDNKPKIKTRRVRFLMINPAAFMGLFKEGLKLRENFEIIEGAPADAKIKTVSWDSYRNAIILVVESREYAPIPVNQIPPAQPISIKVGEK